MVRRARFAVVGAGCLVVALVACVGGPGPLPDPGTDQQQQGGATDLEPAGEDPGAAGTGNGSGNGSTPGGGSGGGSTSGSTPTRPAPVRASSYDQDCSQPSECTAVFEGDPCSPCKCPNAAIATEDASKYSSAIAPSPACPPQDRVACAPCQSATAQCTKNRCALVLGANDGG